MPSPRGDPLRRARDEALCVKPKNNPSIPRPIGGPLCRASKEALCAEP